MKFHDFNNFEKRLTLLVAKFSDQTCPNQVKSSSGQDLVKNQSIFMNFRQISSPEPDFSADLTKSTLEVSKIDSRFTEIHRPAQKSSSRSKI